MDKRKVPDPFTSEGICDDEVQLTFDDGETILISRNFLSLASPVFEAMFKHHFKEKSANCVNLGEKKHSDMLEFLSCIHPRILKKVDQSNVLIVTPIAEEYQVTSLTNACMEVLDHWLDDCVTKGKQMSQNFQRHYTLVTIILEILLLVEHLGYRALITKCIEAVAHFGQKIFTGEQLTKPNASVLVPGLSSPFGYCVVSVGDINMKNTDADPSTLSAQKYCQQLYSSLPSQVQCQILTLRLSRFDDNMFRLL